MQSKRTHLGCTKDPLWYHSFIFSPISGTTQSFRWSDSDCQYPCMTVHLNSPCGRHLGVCFSSDQVPDLCTVGEEKSCPFSISPQFLQKPFARCPSPIRLACATIIQCLIITLIIVLIRTLSVQPRPDFSRRSVLVRGCPPCVDEIHDCIVNYKPAGTQRYPQCRGFIREFDASAPSDQMIRSAVAGNIPVSRYPCDTDFDTDFISVSHLIAIFATLVHHLAVYYTKTRCFYCRLAVGKYCDSSLVNIYAWIAENSVYSYLLREIFFFLNEIFA